MGVFIYLYSLGSIPPILTRETLRRYDTIVAHQNRQDFAHQIVTQQHSKTNDLTPTVCDSTSINTSKYIPNVVKWCVQSLILPMYVSIADMSSSTDPRHDRSTLWYSCLFSPSWTGTITRVTRIETMPAIPIVSGRRRLPRRKLRRRGLALPVWP